MPDNISQLSIEQLENLAEALLDFSTEGDLVAWLEDNLTQAGIFGGLINNSKFKMTLADSLTLR